MTESLLGAIAALASALAWAYGAILFRRLVEKVLPLGLTLIKSLIGMCIIGALLVFLRPERIDGPDVLNLALSGLVGIAIGDALFFKSLLYLGPRLAILLGCSGPVFTVVLAVLILRESVSGITAFGIAMVISGVAWVLWEYENGASGFRGKARGVFYALLSSLCMSVGIILAKEGVGTTSALQATFIRLFAGALGLLLWGVLTRQMGSWLAPLKDPRLLRTIFSSTFVVIFGGFWLFLVALKYTDASIATTLNSTTPLFILPLAAWILRERISRRAVWGAVLAVSGIALIFLR